MNAYRPNSKKDQARVQAITAAIASGETIVAVDTGKKFSGEEMVKRAVPSKREHSVMTPRELVLYHYRTWLKVEVECLQYGGYINYDVLAGRFSKAADRYLAIENVGMQPLKEWQAEAMPLLLAEWFGRALATPEAAAPELTVTRNGELLINPEFKSDPDCLTYEVKTGWDATRKYSMDRVTVIHLIKTNTLVIEGPRPEWANVEPETEPVSIVKAVNGLQSVSEVYGFSKQKQRLLDRIDELIGGLKAGVAEPENEDAQRQIDGYSIVRTAGEVFLHHDNSKNDLHIGTGTVYDCQRYAIVQFVRKVKFGKKPTGDDSRLAAFVTQQVDGLIGDIEKVLRKPQDITLRGGLKLGCTIEEDESDLWLHHPAVAKGIMVASRTRLGLVSRIDRAEIRELVLAVREKNESKRAEQKSAPAAEVVAA